MIGRGHAAIDRLLQQNFLDVVGRKSAFRQRRAHVHAKFVPLTEGDHGSDHEHAAGALVQISPHAWRVIKSMKSALNEFLLAIDLSTHASPSTLRRWFLPSSRRC